VPQTRRPTLPLRLLGLALIVALGPRPSGSRAAEDPARDVGLTIVSQSDHSLIRPGDPGTQGNKYGFEGGSVVKLGGIYHLFTSEMVGDPRWVKMRLARWTSRDRTTWKREATLYESSGNFDGTDPRAALWAPMPVFNDRTDHWELFYVAYRCAPDTPEKWLGNYEGRIWRAVSTQAGRGGIAGPYNDVGVILEPGKLSDPWEGLQGTDSFYPYKAAGRWYGFYGSARTEVKPPAYWKVGLASAPDLSGPWTRLSARNPVALDDRNGAENPIVTRLASGIYLAVFDTIQQPGRIGYALSSNGVDWAPARSLALDKAKLWTSDVRTPLGLIPEGDGTFTLFYTGYFDQPGYGTYGGLSLVTLKLGPP
jgi:hypothetical protein